jgi:uncharacterized membrane protein YccC
MISLSLRTKEAIKTGLAMVIAYAISLWMGWENPYWAGFAVAFISLPMIGQSLNKGVLRMVGTLAAVVAALTLLGLFPQDRWWLLFCLSLYLGACTYMLTGRKNQYFWFVGAFVALIILVNTGGTSAEAFSIAMTRAQETGMGILVYTLVSVFLWPRSSMGVLHGASAKLFATQRQLYRSYHELMAGQGTTESSGTLRLQEAELLPRFGQTLDAAETDTYEVYALRYQWRRFHHLSKNLEEILEQWRQSFSEFQPFDRTGLFPNLETFFPELDLRFDETERMLGGEAPLRSPQVITLAVDLVRIRSLPHFQRAAIALLQTQLERLQGLSRSMFDCVSEIKGYGQQVLISSEEKPRHRGLAIDPDRLMAAVRIVMHLWIAFLIWVYVNPPGHASFVQISVTLGMASLMVGVSASTMLLPFALGSAGTGVVYVFLMPHLSGYTELALLIFGWTFVTYYFFDQPHQGMKKLAAIITFLVFTFVQNQQSYSFSNYANSIAMLLLGIALAIGSEYIVPSPRPEKTFLRLLARFFRHSEFLMSRLALDWGQKGRLNGLWNTNYYNNDLLAIPPKLAKWGQRIDYRTFSNPSPEQVQALVTSLQALAYRIKALVEARQYPQSELLVRQLHDDLRSWRIRVENLFHRWSENPTDTPENDLQERFAKKLVTMEERIKETVDPASPGSLNEEDYENFYRLLGSFRGLSESVVGHARLAEQFDFTQWREARF